MEDNTVTITMDVLQLETIMQGLQHSAETYFQAHFYAKGNEAMRLYEMLRHAKAQPEEAWGTLAGAERYLEARDRESFMTLRNETHRLRSLGQFAEGFRWVDDLQDYWIAYGEAWGIVQRLRQPQEQPTGIRAT